MPTWGGVLNEIGELQKTGAQDAYDRVRRNYLVQLNRLTGRNVILYASGFTSRPQSPPHLLTITDEDLQGLMETVYGLTGPSLDLVLHSPGGEINATEAVVAYLRSKFTDIRVLVPSLAFSAATMIACSGDEIVMGKHSFLGPIDPQITLNTPLGVRMVPAQAVLEQFDKAKAECADPRRLTAWVPMLSQYGPDLLVQCELISDRSRALVCGWLEKYMFKADADRATKAARISEWLGTHLNHKAHGRHIPRDELIGLGLNVKSLEEDQNLQETVLSLFHAATHTFAATPVTKIIENHNGRAFMKVAAQQVPMVGPSSSVSIAAGFGL